MSEPRLFLEVSLSMLIMLRYRWRVLEEVVLPGEPQVQLVDDILNRFVVALTLHDRLD